MNPRYETHIPLLKACCDRFKSGLIVEFGCGDASTPFLHETYEHMQIITVENRLEWFLRWSHLVSRWHQFVFCTNPLDAVRFAFGSRVAFVDCDPGSARAPIVRALANIGEGIVVAHDTQPDCCPEYAWGDCFSGFQYRIHDPRQKPWTTAASNEIDVTTLCVSTS